MNISVIIPTLDEISDLPKTIANLRESDPAPHEVIVSDGGSRDGTREWLEEHVDGTWLRTVDSQPSRGVQMNRGASAATGDLFVFLHADAHLHTSALGVVSNALSKQNVAGGAFTIRFAPEPGAPVSMPVIAAGINFRTRVTRTATGDQAIFVRRNLFHELGGFKDWPLFEDVDLVTRIKRFGEFEILNLPVTISDRRYRTHGPWRTSILMWWLRMKYWAGVAPEDLKRSFVDVRLTGVPRQAIEPTRAAANRVEPR